MLDLRCSPAASFTGRLPAVEFPRNRINSIIVCATKGPRPRYPRVWKSKNRIGTISKSIKLVERVKELSNVKEQVYGDLDTFIAWELEFPLITVKKALHILEGEKEWKRIIQVTKWMLSKGQGRTMGSYYTLLNALAEDERIEEAEELWKKLFSENLESTPRKFFEKMVTIYYQREMHDQIFEIFADMEELGQRPTPAIISMVGDVFQKLGMLDKYEKLNRKYAPARWEYRYFNGKRVKVRSKNTHESERDGAYVDKYREETSEEKSSLNENEEATPNELKDEVDKFHSEHSNESVSDSNETERLSEKNGEDLSSNVPEDEVDQLSDDIGGGLSGLHVNVEASSDLLEDEVDGRKSM